MAITGKIPARLAAVVVLAAWTPRIFAQNPYIYGAANTASYDNTALAQGSLVVLFGYDLGPEQLVQATAFPLPFNLSGTSVSVTSGGTTLPCPLLYTSSRQVALILPSGTPTGQATLSLSYKGRPTPDFFPFPITVVPSSVGIYTLNSQGTGPGIFTALDGSVISRTGAAKPGDVITLWATGAGPRTGGDSQPASVQNFPGVEVYVGTQSAKVLYAGASPCCAGLDQIAFEMPNVTGSCFMPVGVRSGGIVSNFVSVPVSAGGQPCSDSPPAIPTGAVSRALAGEPLRVGAFVVAPSGLQFSLNQSSARKAAAETLSKALNRPVTQREAQKVVAALRNRNHPIVRRALGKRAKELDRIEPQLRKIIQRDPTLTPLVVTAEFGTVTGIEAFVPLIGSTVLPPIGACTAVSNFPTPTSKPRGEALNGGRALSFVGPSGQLNIPLTNTGRYQAELGPAFNGPSIPAGTYGFSGPGNGSVGPFAVSIDVPSHIVWTNKSSISSLDRTAPLTLSWTGGGSGHVLIAGASSRGGFSCTEVAAKGTFTVPAVFLSRLGVTSDQMILVIGQHPFDQAVTVPGLDLSWFIDGSSDSKQITIRN